VAAQTARERKKVSPPLAAPAVAAARPAAGLWPLLLLAYPVLTLIGFNLLQRPGVMVEGQQLSEVRAIMIASSTLTLTGFQFAVGPNEFNPESIQGPAIILTLTMAGTLLALVAGGCAARRALRLPCSDRQIIIAAVVAEALAVLAGSAGLLGEGRSFYEAIQLAVSAFGNSGAVVFRPNAGGMPALTSWRVHGVLLPLSVLGGLGLPVLMELYDALFGIRPLSRHSRTVLTATAALYVISVVGLAWCMLEGDSPAPASVREALVKSSATILDARTAGLPLGLIKNVPVSQWLIVLLMIIGGSPAGTAGGVKVTTFWVLGNGVVDILRRRAVSRVAGIAAIWLVFYLAAALVGVLAISAAEPQLQSDRVWFMTISALSNVGLSHDPISIVGAGSYALSTLMLIGRIAPLIVLWILALWMDEVDVLVG
jgi:hypothetical protein